MDACDSIPQGMKDAHDVVHLELEQEQTALGEMRKMLKALANTLKALCAEGKLPEHSRNLLVNPQFATPGGVAGMPVQVRERATLLVLLSGVCVYTSRTALAADSFYMETLFPALAAGIILHETYPCSRSRGCEAK